MGQRQGDTLSVNGGGIFNDGRLTAGTHSVLANYSGDSSHTPSSATLVGGQVVGMRRVYLPLIAR